MTTDDGQHDDEALERDRRDTMLRLVFSSDPARFEAFCAAIRDAVPPGTRVVVRGSAVTGVRWKDGAPFDADGPGTSDLDLTLVGGDAVGAFEATGFFVPGVHSRPLGEGDPDIAPAFVPLREHLTQLIGRPVNIQATRSLVMALRGDLLGQPYLTLREATPAETPSPAHLVTPPSGPDA
jgi:hypothetical protein